MSKTLATVSMGCGCAPEIKKLFSYVTEWEPDLDYDAILFEGGSDIDPSLYNSKNIATYSQGQSKRDRIEAAIMQDAIDKKALIIGICRGAQLACALAGGKLVQDVNGHQGHHTIETYMGNTFDVSSVHHQQMYPWDVEHTILAWSKTQQSNHFIGDSLNLQKHIKEPEAVFFPKINALAFQWHPEWAYTPEELEFTLAEIAEKL